MTRDRKELTQKAYQRLNSGDMEKILIKNILKTGEKFSEKHESLLAVEVPSYADVSDGYHTIEELYDHRVTLYIALCSIVFHSGWLDADEKILPVWRSKLHHDGTSYDGWFMLAIGNEEGKQITYHIPLSRWSETDFAETFDKAPVKFDGHTSDDVLKRLKTL